MTHVARLAPWINRLVLVVAAFIFTMIGLRYVVDPVRTLAAIGVMVGSEQAAARMRVGSAGFPLACAIFCLGCLSSIHRLTAGVSLVVAVMTAFITLAFLAWRPMAWFREVSGSSFRRRSFSCCLSRVAFLNRLG